MAVKLKAVPGGAAVRRVPSAVASPEVTTNGNTPPGDSSETCTTCCCAFPEGSGTSRPSSATVPPLGTLVHQDIVAAVAETFETTGPLAIRTSPTARVVATFGAVGSDWLPAE